ncbi:MAG: hypothetical protein M1828_000299 [Chrysothrix sp. TS-e1954]|nr:MAG: hypothetical protein M1828_000299 [Chrysothrix sp. TS-e1954]
MVIKSSMSVPIPDVDLTSFLLDGIPDQTDDALFTQPFLFSAEDPEKQHLSLVEFKSLVKQFAAGLQGSGLKNGDHVMLVSPNYIYSIVVCLGVIAAGGIFCTSQPDFKVREYVDQLKRDRPHYLLVCDEEPLRSAVLQAWKTYHGALSNCWLFDSNSCSQHESQIPHWSSLLDRDHGQGFSWNRLSTETDCLTPCQLFYTSGTEGARKAAIISHRNIVGALTGTGYRIGQDVAKLMADPRRKATMTETRRILHTISIARGFGTSLPLAIVKSRQRAPLELYFMSKTWVAMGPYLNLVQNLKITEISAAPFTVSRLFPKITRINDPASRYDFRFMRSMTVTGAPCAQSTLDRARLFLMRNGAPPDVRVERAYAVTEAGSIVTTWHMADSAEPREGCQGKLEPNMEAKIMSLGDEDEEQSELLLEQTGELWLRGPTFIRKYYDNEAASINAFKPDGWYRTGDVGFFSDDKLYLVDRKKDILKTPDNVPPSQIERVLQEHPDVSDAGVIGIYQPEKELQHVRAYIVKIESSSLSEAELVTWMERESASTAHLTGGVVFVDSLPRNSMGKLLRRELYQVAAKELGRPDVAGMTLAQIEGKT